MVIFILAMINLKLNRATSSGITKEENSSSINNINKKYKKYHQRALSKLKGPVSAVSLLLTFNEFLLKGRVSISP